MTGAGDRGWEQLGDAERYVADKLSGSFSEALKQARRLVESLEEMEGLDYEAALLDPGRRKNLVESADLAEKLPGQIALNSLVPVVMKAMMVENEPKERQT